MAKLKNHINGTELAGVCKDILVAAIQARKTEGIIDAALGDKLGEAFVAIFKKIAEAEA